MSPHTPPTFTILVVEDDPGIRNLVADILQTEGHCVETAENGREGLVKIERSVPDFIVMDLRMPVMNGWEFARELKARSMKIPLIVLSAALHVQDWGGQVEACETIAKPFTLQQLLSAVTRVGDLILAARQG